MLLLCSPVSIESKRRQTPIPSLTFDKNSSIKTNGYNTMVEVFDTAFQYGYGVRNMNQNWSCCQMQNWWKLSDKVLHEEGRLTPQKHYQR